MEFNFDKFNDDLEKRENKIKEIKKEETNFFEESEKRRLRKQREQELWQNRISWSEK